VHQHRGVVIADLRDRLDQARRQIELAALPVTRQVLRALRDRAVFVDDARASDPDERCELKAFGIGRREPSAGSRTSFARPSTFARFPCSRACPMPKSSYASSKPPFTGRSHQRRRIFNSLELI
jgi:hypothetical protein